MLPTNSPLFRIKLQMERCEWDQIPSAVGIASSDFLSLISLFSSLDGSFFAVSFSFFLSFLTCFRIK